MVLIVLIVIIVLLGGERGLPLSQSGLFQHNPDKLFIPNWFIAINIISAFVLFVDHLLRRPMGLNVLGCYQSHLLLQRCHILHVMVTRDLSISHGPSPTIFYRDASSALLLYTLSTNSG